MDFTLDEEQSAIAELAGKILGDLCTPEALRAHEVAGEPVLDRGVDRRWPRPTCSAWPCPSRSAAVATASSRRR